MLVSLAGLSVVLASVLGYWVARGERNSWATRHTQAVDRDVDEHCFIVDYPPNIF